MNSPSLYLYSLLLPKQQQWSPSFGETAKQVLSAQVLDRLTQKAQEAFYNKNFYQVRIKK
jgi:hypothetical protein